MAKQTINIGTSANDGTGSTLRAAFDITNDNFTELYDGTGGLFHKIEGTNFTGSLLIGHANTGTLSAAIKNTGVGVLALDNLSSGDSNTAVGYNAGSNINSGSFNILIGTQAGDALTSGTRNIAIGNNSLSTEDGHGRNVAIGHNTLFALNAGTDAYNVAIGYDAGTSVTTGVLNTIIGGLSGDALTSGSRNVAVGYNALGSEDTGSRSTAVGYFALNSQNSGSSGNYNIALGYNAGKEVTTGVQNTVIGSLAGDALTEGSNNIIIGYDAAASAVNVSNEVTIGNSSIANVRIPSDSTLKIGASGDLQIEHVSSNSFIKNTATGDLYIENQVDGKDIIFRSDDGSGGLATYFFLNGDDTNTNFQLATVHPDNVKAKFGTSADLQIYHDASNSYIQSSGTGDLIVEQRNDDKDIVFNCDNGSGGVTEYLRLDGSDVRINVNATNGMQFMDNIQAKFGTSGDFKISHDGSDTYIQNVTSHLVIENQADDKDIMFRCDDGSGGIAEYFRVDGGAEIVVASKEFRFVDNVPVKLGTGPDFQMLHNGTSTSFENSTGNLLFTNLADDSDIIFKSDDGSGGVETYFFLDGSVGVVNFPDDKRLTFGTDRDLFLYHTGAGGVLSNFTGNFIIENRADDSDIVFQCDDGSGGVTTYFKLDGSSTDVQYFKDLLIADNVKANFGNSSDLQISHNGTNTDINNFTGNLNILNAADDGDIIFYSDDGSGGNAEYFRLDGGLASSGELKTLFPDNSRIVFGDGADFNFYHDGTDSRIQNTTGHIRIINFADDKDIIFSSDDGSGGTTEYFRLDGGTVKSIFSKPAQFIDSTKLFIGSSNDLEIFHDGSNTYLENYTGDFIFTQALDDGDMIFKCDNGSGGVAAYITLDGSDVVTLFSKDTRHIDSVAASFGNSNDLKIQHNGTDNFIDSYTGHLNIRNHNTDKDIILQADGGSGSAVEYMRLDGSQTTIRMKRQVKWDDNIKATFGNSDDLQIQHNGTNSVITNGTGEFRLVQSKSDADLVLQCDDGSGGETAYITLDGSEVSTVVNTIKVLMPNLPTSDPSVAGQLYTDSGVLKVSAG